MEENNLEQLHQEAMKRIENAKDFRELPRLNKIMILTRLKTHFENDKIKEVESGDLVEVANALVKGKDINDTLRETLERLEVGNEDLEEVYTSAHEGILQDIPLKNMVEELKAKEDKVAELYEERHEGIIKKIEDAETFEELPTNRTTSTLTKYLSSNSSIYVEGVSFAPSDFRMVTYMLLSGKKIEDEKVVEAIKASVKEKYPDNCERYSNLLIEKLMGLPYTYGLVEEINKKNEKDAEFIAQGLKDVNIYFLPIIDVNAPKGGKFYACFVNTGKVLAMDQLLPEITEKELNGSKQIADYIRDNYDPTFKVGGASILGKGYRIRDVYFAGEQISPEKGNVGTGMVVLSKERYEELLKAEKEKERLEKENEAYKTFLGTVKEALEETERNVDSSIEEDIEPEVEEDAVETNEEIIEKKNKEI